MQNQPTDMNTPAIRACVAKNIARFGYWAGILSQAVAVISQHRLASMYSLSVARSIPLDFDRSPLVQLFLPGALGSFICAIILLCQNKRNWLYLLFNIILFLEISFRM
jgi:hypothetical protein